MDDQLAEKLQHLAKMPAWDELANLIETKYRERARGFGQQLMAGTDISQREVDFLRGFYQGARYIVARPVKALSQIEKAAEQAAKEATS